MIEFQMPSLGADMEAGILREWYKKPGDEVKRGDIIADIETQKGIIEIEVFDEGKIEKLLIKENEKVPVGTVMALIAPLSESKIKISEQKPTGLPDEMKTHRIRISPLARKLAEENKIDISKLTGSGEEGAITKADIEKLIEEQKTVITSTPGQDIRLAIAAAMSKSNTEIPHYYLETRVDLSNALNWLQEKNKTLPVAHRILPVAMFIKAVALSLKEFPDLNAIWDKGLLRKEAIGIGLVTSLKGGGIIIPTIKNANSKDLEQIMIEVTDLITRSRSMKLRSSDLSESTISITNLGDNAVETVFGLIYPPQVALIGFGGIIEEPWAEKGMLNVRKVVHISLSADHRATDGHTGSRFLETLRSFLLNPEML